VACRDCHSGRSRICTQDCSGFCRDSYVNHSNVRIPGQQTHGIFQVFHGQCGGQQPIHRLLARRRLRFLGQNELQPKRRELPALEMIARRQHRERHPAQCQFGLPCGPIVCTRQIDDNRPSGLFGGGCPSCRSRRTFLLTNCRYCGDVTMPSALAAALSVFYGLPAHIRCSKCGAIHGWRVFFLVLLMLVVLPGVLFWWVASKRRLKMLPYFNKQEPELLKLRGSPL
jgi:hypothetical protein